MGDGSFADVAMALGADDIRDARGVGVSDFDSDGDLDLVINHNPGVKVEYREGIAPALLRNDVAVGLDGQTKKNQNWLGVELEGGIRSDATMTNVDAIGAEVVAHFKDGSKKFRHMLAGSSYASQCSKRLHFGLGKHLEVEKLVVRWKRPKGSETVLENVKANQVLKINQYQRAGIPVVTAQN